MRHSVSCMCILFLHLQINRSDIRLGFQPDDCTWFLNLSQVFVWVCMSEWERGERERERSNYKCCCEYPEYEWMWYAYEFSRLHNLHPWCRSSLLYVSSLVGEFSTFSAANAIHNSSIFVPPGTHHCWVDRSSMKWEVCLTLLHMTSSGNLTPDLLILSPTPYPLGHMLQELSLVEPKLS